MIEITCTNRECDWSHRSNSKPKSSVCCVCGAPLDVTALLESANALPSNDLETLHRLGEKIKILRHQIRRAVIGQDKVITFLLTALMADGHCLLEGVPGLAKTLMVESLSRTLGLNYRRIQFTPDMMPADITGTEIPFPDDPTRTKFQQGPIFTNFVLADEINRTPPKTQAALLEAMQEKTVSVGNRSHELERPFFVMATQNPVEQEGTYPLPEAQQDRFLFKLLLSYPTDKEEHLIMSRALAKPKDLEKVFTSNEIEVFQELVKRIVVNDRVCRYAGLLVRATRPHEPEALKVTNQVIAYGAGPRASMALLKAAKALAAVEGQPAATVEHIQRVAPEVLRHRIILKFDAKDSFHALAKDKVVSAPEYLHADGNQPDDLEPDVVIRELLSGKSAGQLKAKLKGYLQ